MQNLYSLVSSYEQDPLSSFIYFGHKHTQHKWSLARRRRYIYLSTVLCKARRIKYQNPVSMEALPPSERMKAMLWLGQCNQGRQSYTCVFVKSLIAFSIDLWVSQRMYLHWPVVFCLIIVLIKTYLYCIYLVSCLNFLYWASHDRVIEYLLVICYSCAKAVCMHDYVYECVLFTKKKAQSVTFPAN